jgi:hypothetical protein
LNHLPFGFWFATNRTSFSKSLGEQNQNPTASTSFRSNGSRFSACSIIYKMPLLQQHKLSKIKSGARAEALEPCRHKDGCYSSFNKTCHNGVA